MAVKKEHLWLEDTIQYIAGACRYTILFNGKSAFQRVLLNEYNLMELGEKCLVKSFVKQIKVVKFITLSEYFVTMAIIWLGTLY